MKPKPCALRICVVAIVAFHDATAMRDEKVGSIKNSKHEVAGTLYVVDEKTLRIKDFFYDGTAPESVAHKKSKSIRSDRCVHHRMPFSTWEKGGNPVVMELCCPTQRAQARTTSSKGQMAWTSF